ncbi:MAG: hypothetical protein K1X28_05655 [Parachlamydiales bacterium]|nr:hypothetical protein [Parachlamydiales bacterium]
MRKKLALFFVFLLLSFPILYKAAPVVRDKECYRSFFPKEAFLAKLAKPPPSWMLSQISADLSPFPQITQESLDQTYEHVSETFDRYRIFNNRLYKFVPPNKRLSSRDNVFERALKTLLLYAKLPNVDFIYCPMDGLPEPYMAQNFYHSEPQAPIFAKARLALAPHIILIPDQFSLSENWFEVSREILALNEVISWDDKKPLAMWRGGLTDIGIPNGSFAPNYRDCPRYKISKLPSEWVDAGLQWSDCAQLDKLLEQEGATKNGASKQEHLQFKYLPVLDGHMCTYPGYQWRLLSNSVSFKQESDQEQWFYSALKPYTHYIPIKNDMSDLIEKVEWARSHDTEVQQIIQNAQDFAKNNLLPEDDYLYLYLALKECALRQENNWKKMDDSWVCIQYRKRLDLQKSWNRLLKNSLK